MEATTHEAPVLGDGLILEHIRSIQRGRMDARRNPGEPGLVTIPHPRKDLGTGVFRNILRQAGLV